jgi:F-type H+-transporting ATPase subunit epsilon
MHLGIYSLEKVLFRGEASLVNCPTESGEITILENHRPLISLLKRGLVKVVDGDKKEHYIPISSGFLEVRKGNQIKFLVTEDKA